MSVFNPYSRFGLMVLGALLAIGRVPRQIARGYVVHYGSSAG